MPAILKGDGTEGEGLWHLHLLVRLVIYVSTCFAGPCFLPREVHGSGEKHEAAGGCRIASRLSALSSLNDLTDLNWSVVFA